MEREEFTKRRDQIVKIMEEAGASEWEAAGIAASALNEFLAPGGRQAIVILRPLLAYREAEDRV